MEYVIFWTAIALLMAILIAKGAWDSHKEEQKFKKRLYDDYGALPDREYKSERFARLGSFYQKHSRGDQIDDITWNDLNMDEVFKRMNYTLSSTGEEYLYYTLRSPKQSVEELQHFEEIVNFFRKNVDERVKVQLLMKKLGATGKFSIYDYLENLNTLGMRSNRKHILLDLAFLPLIVGAFFYPSVCLAAVAGLMIYNIATYFREKKEIEPYVISFAYVVRLLDICGKLVKIPVPVCNNEWKAIKEHKGKLGRMKTGSFWVLSGAAVNLTGNPLDILVDYIRMAFHVDLIKFNNMLSELNAHLEDVDVLVEQVGYLETAIVVGAYRESLQDSWCRPQITEETGIRIEEGYHPLIADPVKNSISTDRGVLLTGSNASGKSTFLKTIALEILFAQTIHTCLADGYQAPLLAVYSSMSLRDDLESGESYYMVEIKSLKRILDAAESSGRRVVCFVDEVLRGTNTVERIAASTQILKSLGGSNLLCFAATHDIELTDLLKDYYENYHFEEEIKEGDIFFNYKLLEGKATTRNAIKLLEIMGYSQEIIEQAGRQAERFASTGKWELA